MKTNITNKFKAMALPACAALALLALLASTANSEAAAFLQLPGVDGESTDREYKDWIIIESVTTPIVREPVVDPETGVSLDRGAAVFGDIVLVKKTDKSTPELIAAVSEAGGTFYDEVEIHFTTQVKNKQEPYVVYKLKNVTISSYKFHTNADDTTAIEEITLGYTDIEWTIYDPKTGSAHVVFGDGSVRF